MRSRVPRLTVAAGVVSAVLLLASCANDSGKAEPKRPGGGVDIGDVQLVAALTPFDRCEAFLDHVKAEALKRVGPYGLDGGGMVYAAGDMARTTDAAEAGDATAGAPVRESASAPTAAPAQTDAANTAGTGDDTGTNNQETGVDEADIVKVDGDRVITVRNRELIVTSIADGAPKVTGRVDLDFNADRLFVTGNRAYVMGYSDMPMPTPRGPVDGVSADIAYSGGGGAGLAEVSLDGEPKVLHRTTVDGSVLDGRLANGTVRLVLSSPAGSSTLGFVYPTSEGSKAVEVAEAANRKLIEDSTIDDWIPHRSDGGAERQPLADCSDLYRPAEFSGFSMLSVLTIGDGGLASMTASGVLADGGTTYASTDHLYVATTSWGPIEASDDIDESRIARVGGEHTDVHSFSITGTDKAAYEASGRVEGHLLNQYSMSESGDDLRIATTTNSGWGGGVVDCPPNAECAAPVEQTAGQSRVVVLRRNGEVLEQIGMVDGLGPSEQIKSVRYVGDIAYVVTFRQTDPFYVVDLADPTAPKILGELKVPGFSSYLHPVGDHLVLGVGSDATDEGRVTGAKVSLYDTSDPVAPREVTTLAERSLDFLVAGDPKAFSWDAARSTAYLPFYAACWDVDVDNCVTTNGVLVVRVADGAITEIGRIDHNSLATVPGQGQDPGQPIPLPVPVPIEEPGSPGTSSDTEEIVESAPATEPGFAPDVMPYSYSPTITRAFVVGDRIVTLSDAGLATHAVDSLTQIGAVRL